MYELHWITDHLATGHAPMSYDELDAIRAQGIGAIVNLCGEFCDLHEIEDSSGFDVYYLPVVDEHAPDLEAMERALDWMDEAIYLDKKVLVHCRMGHGRTGTFIAAYLLRRGFDFKAAERTMKGRKAVPATYDQRRFLKKYGKQVGPLQTAAPRIDNRPATAVDTVITAYHDLLARFDEVWPAAEEGCGRDDHPCCGRPFDLQLIESMHLSQVINRTLRQKQRQEVIDRAFALAGRLKELHQLHPGLANEQIAAKAKGEDLTCPLLEEGACLVFTDRPPRCRYWNHAADDERLATLQLAIDGLSRQAYRTLTGQEPPAAPLCFSSADTISGKFVELYFRAMLGRTE